MFQTGPMARHDPFHLCTQNDPKKKAFSTCPSVEDASPSGPRTSDHHCLRSKPPSVPTSRHPLRPQSGNYARWAPLSSRSTSFPDQRLISSILPGFLNILLYSWQSHMLDLYFLSNPKYGPICVGGN